MKKTIFLLVFIFGFSSIFAQNDKTHSDSTKIKLGNKTIIIVEKKDKSKSDQKDIEITIDSIKLNDNDETVEIKKNKKKKYNARKYSRWNGIYLGFNQFVERLSLVNGLDGDLEDWTINPWKSTTWDINILEYSVSPVKRHVLLTTGLGFEFRKYSFDKNIDIKYGQNGKMVPVINSENDYTKNYLSVSYVQVPIMLEINTSSRPEKGMYFAFGVIGGYRMFSETTQKYKNNGQKYKVEVHDDFGLNPYQLEGTFRIGFNRFTIFTNVDISSVFRHYSSQGIGNISIGIKLI